MKKENVNNSRTSRGLLGISRGTCKSIVPRSRCWSHGRMLFPSQGEGLQPPRDRLSFFPFSSSPSSLLLDSLSVINSRSFFF